MTTNSTGPDRVDNGKRYVNIAIDLILKIGALFLLVFLCLRILRPFLSILLWGLIIAIVIFPFFRWLQGKLGKRSKLTAILIVVLALSVLVMPSIWLVNQLIEGVRFLAEHMQAGVLEIPGPSPEVADWPLIGEWLYENWTRMADHPGKLLAGYLPQMATSLEKGLGALANTGLGLLQFAASVIIAGVFLIFSEKGEDSGHKVFEKIAGERGDEFLKESLRTIRNVATGVLGVALIQTTLMGIGLILANVPLAAVWIVVLLIMTIAQIPALIFNVFLIIYLFAFREPLPAAAWSLYFLVMGFIDNLLKPVLMGKGSDVPMLVIFLGALGGFIAFGFIGLFLGSIVLSLVYKLYVTWVS